MSDRQTIDVDQLLARLEVAERRIQAMAVVIASVEMAVDSEGLGEHGKRDRHMNMTRNMEAAFGWIEQDENGSWQSTAAYPFTWDLD